MSYIELKNASKKYLDHEGNTSTIFKNLSFSAERGKTTLIMGKSGSGKSTLLNILATIDEDYEGSLFIDNQNITALSEKKKAFFRRKHIGFIFQNHDLLSDFTILENCALMLQMNGSSKKEAQKEALNALKEFLPDVDNYNKYPRELSGGQQQRAGIVRALIHKPDIIFADEPTGNLDKANADKVKEYLQNMAKEYNLALVIVTHDINYKKMAQYVFDLPRAL